MKKVIVNAANIKQVKPNIKNTKLIEDFLKSLGISKPKTNSNPVFSEMVKDIKTVIENSSDITWK